MKLRSLCFKSAATLALQAFSKLQVLGYCGQQMATFGSNVGVQGLRDYLGQAVSITAGSSSKGLISWWVGWTHLNSLVNFCVSGCSKESQPQICMV